MSTHQSLFGKLSVSSAIVSAISIVVFIVSGTFLSSVGEQVIVIVQMLSLFLMPLAALVGLICGIVGIFRDLSNAKAKIGLSINVVLLLLQVAAVMFLLSGAFSFS